MDIGDDADGGIGDPNLDGEKETRVCISTTACSGGLVFALNELLHWGSLNDGQTGGDPHLTTVEALRYDFQAADELVALRDDKSLEIQTRQTPVSTAAPLFKIIASQSSGSSTGSSRVPVPPDLEPRFHRFHREPRRDGGVDRGGRCGSDPGERPQRLPYRLLAHHRDDRLLPAPALFLRGPLKGPLEPWTAGPGRPLEP